MMDPGLQALAVLGCALGGVVLFALGVLALRMVARPRRDGLSGARSLLHKRLAAGEIDVDEYYERESALRQSEPRERL
jgi:uncharacterized membrane protein